MGFEGILSSFLREQNSIRLNSYSGEITKWYFFLNIHQTMKHIIVEEVQDELSGMKHRIRVVILENDNLQEELKLKTVEDTLKDYTILDTSTNALESCLTGRTVPRAQDSRQHSHRQQQQQPPTAPRQPLASNGPTEALKWQMELVCTAVIYLSFSSPHLFLLNHWSNTIPHTKRVQPKKDLGVSQKDCEEMKGRLRHQESVAAMSSGNRIAGLCLKCAQHEAVLAQTHADVHMQAIERLTRERDELMAVISSQRSNQGEMQQRESSAYRQVKQAVEMAEEANLEKTQV
ncbi:UNVERIFIED_CONTAM: hypothetical protein FKN15_000995 [Acipenser sinensis]